MVSPMSPVMMAVGTTYQTCPVSIMPSPVMRPRMVSDPNCGTFARYNMTTMPLMRVLMIPPTIIMMGEKIPSIPPENMTTK